MWAAIGYNNKSPLVRIRRRRSDEWVKENDNLGLNEQQYATEINESCLVPFIYSQSEPVERIHIWSDGAGYHGTQANYQIYNTYGLKLLPAPPSSPDLNVLENAWNTLKSRLWKRFSITERRPHSEDELFEAACEEWEAISQDTINSWIDSMPSRISAVVKGKGWHTKW